MFDFSEDNVTFVNITACRTAWPNAQNCIGIDFSIRLKLLPKTENDSKATESTLNSSTTETATPMMTTATDSTEYYDVPHDQLRIIWIQFGRKEFSDNGFEVFFSAKRHLFSKRK